MALAAHTASSCGPAPKLTGKCLDCGVAKSATDPFQPGVDACARDWETYLAFTHLGTFEDYLKRKASDEQVARQADEAKQVLSKKKEADWPETEVREEDGIKVRVFQPMVGPTRAQIVTWTGCTPEELGMQLQSLVDANQNTYKGVLLPDPMRPYTCFEFASETTISKSQVKMPAGRQIFKAQADSSFQFCRAKRVEEDKFNKVLLTKMQTCPWTMESMFAKSAEVRKQKGLAPMPPRMAGVASQFGAVAPSEAPGPPATGGADGASFEGEPGAANGDEESADEEEGDDAAAASQPKLASVLNPEAMHESMSVCGTLAPAMGKRPRDSDDQSSRRASPGAKVQRCRTVDGIPVLDGDKHDLVQRRVQSADIDKILQGHAMGREIAWTKKTRDQLRTSGDEALANELSEHLHLCTQAGKLTEEPIAKMPRATLELAVKELQDGGITLPATLQVAIYKRAVANIHENLSENTVEQLMVTILPWSVGKDQGEEVFDGLAPRLAGLGRVPLEAAATFQEGLISGIAPLIAKGADQVGNVVRICGKAMAFLEEHADGDGAEVFDDALSELLTCLRVLKMLGDPYCVAYPKAVEAFDSQAAKKDRATKASQLYALHFALKSDSCWWGLHAEHIARFEATAKHIPEMAQHSRNLCGIGSLDPAGQALLLQQVLKDMPMFLAGCKDQVYTDFKQKVEEHFTQCVGNFFAKEPDFKTADLAKALAAWRAALEKARVVVPSIALVCSDGLQRLTAWESCLCKLRALDDFDKLRQSTTKESFATEDSANTIHMAVRRMLESATGEPEQVEQLQSLSQLAVESLLDHCENGEKAEPLLEFLRTVHGAPFYPKDDKARDVVVRLEAWKPLMDAKSAFDGLGPDLPTRAAAPAAEAKVIELLSLAKTFTHDPGLFVAGSKPTCFKDEIENEIKSIRDEMIKQAHSHIDKADANIRSEIDGSADGKAWFAQIPHGKEDDLDTVMAIAQKTLLAFDGKLFDHKLDQLKVANGRLQRVHELFDTSRDDHDIDELILRGQLTKYTSLMAHQYYQDKKNPNPSKLRRAIKKYRTALQAFADRVQPAIRKWSSEVATF